MSRHKAPHFSRYANTAYLAQSLRLHFASGVA
jgi:hypothetical protein